MFEIRDKLYPQRSYLFNGSFVNFQDYKASVPANIAYRMSRISRPEDFEIIESKPMPYDPHSWQKEKRIIWSSNFASASGFGSVTEHVVLSLLRKGIRVQNPGSISAYIIHGGEHVDKGVEASMNQSIEPTCLEIQYCQPLLTKLDIVQRIWAYAMFETDHTPVSWIQQLNKLERVLVPSSWLVKSWREQGLTVPIDVFHHGIDPKLFYYMERPTNRKKYTFLQFAELAGRKGVDIVFRAFANEFKEEDDVELILKTNKPGIVGVPLEYPKLKIIRSIYSKKQMQELLFSADCFVFPTRGEGFGLTALEAMATGLPTILTDWSGVVDFSDPNDTLIVGHQMVRAYEFDIQYSKDLDIENGENTGYWAEPNYEEVRHWMRWCYENREKAKAMGKQAAARIAKDWTWDKKIQTQLLPLFDKYL